MGKGFITGILTLVLTATLLLLPVAAADSGAGTLTQSSRTMLTPQLTYAAYTYGDDTEPKQKGYGLELAAEGDIYPITMACDTIWGGMTMDACVAYGESLGYNVVAAINTAFFNSPGVPIGAVVEDGVLRSWAPGLHAFAVMPDGTYRTWRDPKVTITMTAAGEQPLTFSLERFNKLLGEGLNLYDSAFSTVSTRVEEDVWVVRMRVVEGEMTLDGAVTLEVAEVLETAKAVPIGEEYMILTASKDGEFADFYENFTLGDVYILKTSCGDKELAQAKYVSGCGDILVENGKITDSAFWSPFVEGYHPRSLLGWKEDGTLVLYGADGRAPDTAEGLTLRMAAEEMLRLGCTYAVNLDGGGSTTVGVRLPGQERLRVVNTPSAGAQRQCAGFLLLVTDAPRDGVARYWHLRENGRLVLPRQKVALHAFATDSGLYPAEGDERALQYLVNGQAVEGAVCTVPDTIGSCIITMEGGGAVGRGELQVIPCLTSFQVTNQFGTPITELQLKKGQSPKLRIRAVYNGRTVELRDCDISYSVNGKFGYVDESGRFTADAFPGTTGILTLSARGLEQQIRITVTADSDSVGSFPRPWAS